MYKIGKWVLQFSVAPSIIDNKVSFNQLYYNWLSSDNICVCENNDGMYALFLPFFSKCELYVKGNIISDNIECLVADCNVDKDSLKTIIQYGFTCAPKTMYQEIKRLPIGHYLQINDKNTEYSFNAIRLLGDAYREKSLKEIFGQCISDTKCVGNTEIGFSGGLDSTLIAEFLDSNSKINLVNIYVEQGRNENKYHDIYLKNKCKKINYIRMTSSDALSAFERHLSEHEIFGMSIVLKYEFLFNNARERSVNSLLLGDGADDLFLNSANTDEFLDAKKRKLYPLFNQWYDKISNLDILHYPYHSENFYIWWVYNFVIMSNANYRFEQRIAKRNNIVLSSPYLKPAMIDYCIEHQEQIFAEPTKNRLKQIAAGRIDNKIINRKKMGFTSDVDIWFKKGQVFNEKLRELLSNDKALFSCEVNKGLVMEKLKQFECKNEYLNTNSGGNGLSNGLFAVMTVLQWAINNL
ncbi:MAG: asparagine synthase-related protein [Bacillota bacterium]